MKINQNICRPYLRVFDIIEIFVFNSVQLSYLVGFTVSTCYSGLCLELHNSIQIRYWVHIIN